MGCKCIKASEVGEPQKSLSETSKEPLSSPGPRSTSQSATSPREKRSPPFETETLSETRTAPRVEPGAQRGGKTWQACAQASDKAVEWLASKVLDKTWVSEHNDVAYYFRLPLAFIEAGRESDAEKVLDIAKAWVMTGAAGSAHRDYGSVYPQYPLLWICWAACRLGRMELAKRCFATISKHVCPVTCSGVNSSPFSQGAANEFDFFATAIFAKAALLTGDSESAGFAGDSLLRALEANRIEMLEGRFFLRWTWMSGLVMERDRDASYCVWQKGSGQQFHLLGFPAAVLAELASENIQAEIPGADFKKGALDLLQYLQKCDGVLSNPTSHQVACAAARARDEEFAAKISNNLVKLQQASGAFSADLQSLDAIDKTAELSICLRQAGKDYTKAR